MEAPGNMWSLLIDVQNRLSAFAVHGDAIMQTGDEAFTNPQELGKEGRKVQGLS